MEELELPGVEETQGEVTPPTSPSELVAKEEPEVEVPADEKPAESTGIANLRQHAKSLESQLESANKYKDAIEEMGGLDAVPVLSKLWGKISSSNFDPHELAVEFNSASPSRFGKFAEYLTKNVQENADKLALTRLFGTANVDKSTLDSFKVWQASGRPEKQTFFEGNLSDDDLVDSVGNELPPKIKELLLQADKLLMDSKKSGEQRTLEEARLAEETRSNSIESAVTKFSEDRIKNVITNTNEGLGLLTASGDASVDSLHQMLASAIHNYALLEFNKDSNAAQLWESAKNHLAENPNVDTNLFAKQLVPRIERRLGEITKPFADLVGEFLEYKRGKIPSQAGAIKGRTEVGDKGSTEVTGVIKRQTPMDFSTSSIQEDINRLIREGRLPSMARN